MRDIRLLTLYKQHYMDSYDSSLKCEYSCWGYYDGMDITEVESKEYSTLLPSNKITPISELWYKTSEQIGQITGQYGCIQIGLFRCISEKETDIQRAEKFWLERESSLFFGAAFLQLENPEEYLDFSREIEKMNIPNKDVHKECEVLTYCTFDNADLVLLICGNSLVMMEQYLQQIEGRKEVRYQHSVLGVSEEYLSECKQKDVILNCWKERRCYIEEEVARLDICMVSSGESNLIDVERNILDAANEKYHIKNFDNAKYAYVSGHENLIISWENTEVKTMLIFLLPEGFATHQNESYRNKIDMKSNQIQPRLYNIETSYVLSYKNVSDIPPNDSDASICDNPVSHNWFEEKIVDYKDKLNDALLCKKDESLYSYYLAVLRTLNTLVQYERFHLSEDIFYLLYSSFRMFDEKLNRALDAASANNRDSTYNAYLDGIKQAICEYIEAVNSVIYHTIHTDQVYLMIPGYSGTSFSIPIKLNLMFLWLTDGVARLFGRTNRKYQCIIVPTMESKPLTKRIKIEQCPENFLVCVKISQRTLYMPKALMIILAHEMGHYIGGDLRCREQRAEEMTKYTAAYLANLIFPACSENNSDKQDIYLQFKNEFEQKAEESMKESALALELKEKGYYGDEVERSLLAACRKVLNECRTINKSIVDIIYNKYKGENGKIETALFWISNLLEVADERAKKALINDKTSEVIKLELKIYKEIFSDIVAVKLLRYDKEAFREAMCISEGVNVSSEESERRERVMSALGEKIGWSSSEKENLDNADQLLFEYADECNNWLDGKLQVEGELGDFLGNVRSLYQLFAETDTKEEFANCHKVYDAILKCITSIKQNIDGELKK